MADTGTVAAAACRNRTPPMLADARGDERDLLCAAWWLCLADAAGAFPAAPDGLPLVHPVSRRRNLGETEPPSGDAGSRTCRPRGQSECRHHRQLAGAPGR